MAISKIPEMGAVVLQVINGICSIKEMNTEKMTIVPKIVIIEAASEVMALTNISPVF